MDKKKTGILIREARTAKNYTQSELGDLLGVSNKAVSRWENGESFPDIGILENLSEVPGVSKLGYMWLIPQNAEKPIDKRRKEK